MPSSLGGGEGNEDLGPEPWIPGGRKILCSPGMMLLEE